MSSPTEFSDLVTALLQGTITAAQHRRLEELLLSNPAAQSEYFAHIDLHLALSRLTNQASDRDPVADVKARERTTSQAGKDWHHQLFWPVSLLAASLAVAVVLLPFRNPSQPQQIAQVPVSLPETAPVVLAEPGPAVRLRHAADAELVREYVPELGSALTLEHEYVLVKGMMELEFANGATTILQAPAVFVVNSAERMELKVGNCSVHAPDSAKGFEVVTPRSRIVDLGTRFSVGVNDAGDSEVQVVEGAAEIYSKADRTLAKTLVKGEASRCAGASEGLQAIRFDPDQYQHRLPDRIISYTANICGDGPGVKDLTSITVQRGGQMMTYSAEELIGIDVLHYMALSNHANLGSDQEELGNITDLIAGDRALNTGLFNFDRDIKQPVDSPRIVDDYRKYPGLAVEFQQPLINGPGPDLVLFEVQSIIYPPEGDHFRVSPLQPGAGLKAHLVTKFDITLNSKNALQVAPFRVFSSDVTPKSLAELTSASYRRGNSMPLPFFALAVGIDLSDLGYAEGAAVPGLFFEDANRKPTVYIDPVFIGGFPTLTTPDR